MGERIMINKNINDLLEVAGQKLAFAEKELSRPSEDSVTFTICHFSNNAIREFLVSLIAYNYSLEYPEDTIVQDTLKVIENWDIDFLMEYSAKLDARFAGLDISRLNCSSLEKEDQSGTYCLTMDTVKRCNMLARQIESMVKEYISKTRMPHDNSDLHQIIKESIN
jgi:hypothetical protein